MCLDVAEFLRIRMGEVQIAAQNRHVQFIIRENRPKMFRKFRSHGLRAVRHARQHLLRRKMHTRKTFLVRFPRAGFQGLFFGAQACVHVMETDADLDHGAPSLQSTPPGAKRRRAFS